MKANTLLENTILPGQDMKECLIWKQDSQKVSGDSLIMIANIFKMARLTDIIKLDAQDI